MIRRSGTGSKNPEAAVIIPIRSHPPCLRLLLCILFFFVLNEMPPGYRPDQYPLSNQVQLYPVTDIELFSVIGRNLKTPCGIEYHILAVIVLMGLVLLDNIFGVRLRLIRSSTGVADSLCAGFSIPDGNCTIHILRDVDIVSDDNHGGPGHLIQFTEDIENLMSGRRIHLTGWFVVYRGLPWVG